jgi:hypothetical protein
MQHTTAGLFVSMLMVVIVTAQWKVSLQGFGSADPCLAYLIHTILMGEVSRRIDFTARAGALPAGFGKSGFCAPRQGSRPLLLGQANGGAERGLNLGLVGTHGREQHPAEPVEFGTPPTFSRYFDQCFCLVYGREGFNAAARAVQGFRLLCEYVGHAQHRAGGTIIPYPFLDADEAFRRIA